MFAIAGHYCPTDANPETEIRGEAGYIDTFVSVVLFETRELAAAQMPWYPDGQIVQVRHG